MWMYTATRTDSAEAADYELAGLLVDRLAGGWPAQALAARKRLPPPPPDAPAPRR